MAYFPPEWLGEEEKAPELPAPPAPSAPSVPRHRGYGWLWTLGAVALLGLVIALILRGK